MALALASALGAALACRNTEPAPEAQAQGKAKSSDELTVDSFRDLIAQGALRPVEAQSMDGEASFKDPAPDVDEHAFERAAEKLSEAHAQAAQPPDAVPGSPAPDLSVPPVVPENPYLTFGKRIQVYPSSGLIMKPYPLRVGTGARLLQLIKTYGNFALWEPGAAPQTKDQVRLEMLEKWDQELISDMRQAAPTGMPIDEKSVPIADWLIVVTGPELLHEVESFINIFAAGVPQIEIEAKIVEVTLNDSLDLGVRPIDAATPIFGFPEHTFVKSFNYVLPNTAGAINSMMQLGAVQDGMAFNAVLQALATYENVSIISRPKIAVREGGRAAIINTLRIPSLNVTGISPDGKYAAGVAYDEVGIKLYVVPRVVGTQTVALNIDIEASAQSGTADTFTVQSAVPGVANTTISNPIISRRAAQTVVYLEPGQAVILGGLITERTVEKQNKVPLLGDLPILGYLFKSTFKQKEQTNVLFFIRPRILIGTDMNREF